MDSIETAFTYTPEELVKDHFIRGSCQNVDNIQIIDELDNEGFENEELRNLRTNYQTYLSKTSILEVNEIAVLEATIEIPTKPVRPVRANKDHFSFDLDISDNASPVVKNLGEKYQNIIWHISPNSPEINTNAFKLEWESMDLKPIDNGPDFELTLINGDRKEYILVTPALSGNEFSKAMSLYDTSMEIYRNKLKDRELTLEKNRNSIIEKYPDKRVIDLTPAAIGYLCSLGIQEVSVFKKPNIAIVTTGNELIEAGQKLSYGKIYESNSKMLLSALYGLKFYDVTLHKVEDVYSKTVEKLNAVIKENDLVLITGGISVGDYDFVGKALKELEVEELFYKVKQKPGKPLFYGKKGDTQIFALPGNPAAALSCFYVYVYIALQKMMNRDILELPRIEAISKSNFEKKGDRPQFLKAIYKNGEVEILEGQNSSMLQTFALSNALVYAPETITKIVEGDSIEVIQLPL